MNHAGLLEIRHSTSSFKNEEETLALRYGITKLHQMFVQTCGCQFHDDHDGWGITRESIKHDHVGMIETGHEICFMKDGATFLVGCFFISFDDFWRIKLLKFHEINITFEMSESKRDTP